MLRNILTIICISVVFFSCDIIGGRKSDVRSSVIDSLNVKRHLGSVVDRTYGGMLPCADCSGIIYELILYNQEYSTEGVYDLTQTYQSTSNGDDVSYCTSGRWNTFRRAEGDSSAIIRLNPMSYSTKHDFLYYIDSLVMLNINTNIISEISTLTLFRKD